MPDPIAGEDLLRNVPPGHYDHDAEEPTPAAVWPRREDNGQLSTDRDSVWSAEESFRFRTTVQKLPSRGVVALAADDLVKRWDVQTLPDPQVEGVDGAVADNPAHALSDFTHLTVRPPAERKKLREAILLLALEGGWLHGPVPD